MTEPLGQPASGPAGELGSPAAASRLVNELMLVSVLVAGEGAPPLAALLEAAGAAAETFSGGQPPEGFDLAILLAPPGSAADHGTRRTVESLSQASERLLFVPLSLGTEASSDPALPQLAEWFEVFAEFGYQPVVEFDASFVAAGAFLVDRAATAAESELAAFADRLQLGGAPAEAAAAALPPAREVEAGLRAKLEAAERALDDARQSLAARTAEIDEMRAELGRLAEQHDGVRLAMQTLENANAGWDGLRHWARALVRSPSRDDRAALARDLPRLNEWRRPWPPVLLPQPPRWRVWRGLSLPAVRRPPAAALAAILADTALVRASPLFDAAWYVAATPELTEDASVDPVFHYVLVGALRGADPGPWFDTAAYLAAHPDAAADGQCSLVHAIRTGHDISINSG